MDSEHRHDLKTNELAQGLAHLPELIKKNANTIIGLALIVVGLITWPMFNKMSRQKALAEQSSVTQSVQGLKEDIYNILNAKDKQAEAGAETMAREKLLVDADSLLQEAAKADNPNLAAMAYIKVAQAYRTELQIRKEIPDVSAAETQIGKAKDAYEKALAAADTPDLKGAAKLGLGLCAEELGQMQQAADIYNQIISDEMLAPTVFQKLAQNRLDSLQDNSEIFTFAQTPVEASEPVQGLDIPTNTAGSTGQSAPEAPEIQAPAEQ